MPHALATIIDAAFEDRAKITPETTGDVRHAVESALNLLDTGKVRVAEKIPGATGKDSWKVNQWLKKAVLLSFRLNDMHVIPGGPGAATWYDKVPSKFEGWGAKDHGAAGFRSVPGCVVRHSAYIAPGVVLMPSFVNLGAHVDTATMVDTWATVGSCAQVGRNVHIAGGCGIGGVLEPPGARPNIVEDGVFLGSRCILVEGVLVEEDAVLGANVCITGSTPIIDVTGPQEVVHKGRVPARSVVIPGTRPKQYPAGTFYIPCALIVGKRSPSTDKKVSLNQALRDFEVQV